MSHPHTHSERVLVVPAAEFDRLGRFQGFCGEADRYLGGLLVPELARFRPRSEVEDDPCFKQIIPYVVFRSDGAVFCYTRGKSQGEARLHRLRSLGVGGHVAEADADGRATLDAYEMALRRELDEEVDVGSPGRSAPRRPDQRRLHARRPRSTSGSSTSTTWSARGRPPRGRPGRGRLPPDRPVRDRPRRVRDLVADLHRRALLAD